MRFRLVPKSTNLNGLYILRFRIRFFGAHHENLNEDRPILLAAKCSSWTTVSGNIRTKGNLQWKRSKVKVTGRKKTQNWQLVCLQEADQAQTDQEPTEN